MQFIKIDQVWKWLKMTIVCVPIWPQSTASKLIWVLSRQKGIMDQVKQCKILILCQRTHTFCNKKCFVWNLLVTSFSYVQVFPTNMTRRQFPYWIIFYHLHIFAIPTWNYEHHALPLHKQYELFYDPDRDRVKIVFGLSICLPVCFQRWSLKLVRTKNITTQSVASPRTPHISK